MGSKHDLLTKEEIETQALYGQVVNLLETYSDQHKVPYSSLRVLDWGCGRGKTVIQLLQMGIDAYGVDIDPGPISNGAPLMRELGFAPENRLICIQPDCKTPFQHNFFHIILSDQVFEHVSDLAALANELSRITCSRGQGLHFFPSKYCIIEPHLLIPLVHWLPKNRLRKWYINLLLDRIPVWRGLENASIAERVDTYYQYSLGKTYYRSLKEIRSHLARQDFEVQFLPSGSPSRRHKLMFPILKWQNKRSAKFWSAYVNRFRVVVLKTRSF